MKEINLIPKKYLIEKQNKKRRFYKKLLLSSFGFIILLLIFIPILLNAYYSKQKDLLPEEDQKTKVYRDVQKQADLIKSLNELREKESHRLSKLIFDPREAIERISSAQTKSIVLNTYSINNESQKTISLSGKAESETEIAQFIKNLEKSSIFSGVGLKRISKEQNNSVSFDILIIMN